NLRLKMLLVLVLFAVGLNSGSLGVVQTEGGRVEGKSHRMGLMRSVDVFKGIPFADVPGKWEKPKPHPGWSGVLKATTYRERCLQVTLLQTKTQGSEDCLYLNIFVPQGRKLSTNLPVMVYLFGGAFLLGASNDVAILGDSLYDGKEMADRGGVIIVTVNYRVGTLGFLSTGDTRMPGNYGLWDQHFAISWVRRNIHSFGGNPDNITIFGQSAGAASVSYQMVSPYSSGLFRRAITQCGVSLSPWALQKNPMALTKKVHKPSPLQTSTINRTKLFQNTAQFDYMAGVNSMDGHIFAGVDVPSINSPTPVEDVRGLLAGLTKEKGTAAISSAYGVYSAHWGSAPDPSVVKKTVADMETDFLFLVPTQIALQLHANNTSGARTYSYLFNMKTRIPGFPSWVGAEHAEDLQYLFGKPFATPLVYFPRHRDLSGYMIAYWTNFARTGDPNTGDSRVPAPWPAFTKYHRPYLTINHKISKSSVSYDLRSTYVDYWTTTYSTLPSVKTQDLD
uniref:Carboxylic ester hydrolase n=1 Tax=Sphaeramia orbicularis TaxID=375764 RepID=A0A672YM10_9TELE